MTDTESLKEPEFVSVDIYNHDMEQVRGAIEHLNRRMSDYHHELRRKERQLLHRRKKIAKLWLMFGAGFLTAVFFIALVSAFVPDRDHRATPTSAPAINL